jgi:hypothetical protein
MTCRPRSCSARRRRDRRAGRRGRSHRDRTLNRPLRTSWRSSHGQTRNEGLSARIR